MEVNGINPNVVEYSQINKKNGNGNGNGNKDFQYPLLKELIDASFVISGASFKQGQYGSYALIYLANGEIFRTSSQSIMKQLGRIAEFIDKTKTPVRVTLRQKVGMRGNYYTFE